MTEHSSRIALGCWPTPLQELERLRQALGGGPRIWVKRDDLSGLAEGGNKTRKLEYLMADALAQQATTVITTGAVQSNHARQTAAAAAHCGLRCVLVLGPVAPAQRNGNLLLDDLLGAEIRWAGERDRFELMQEVAAEERAAGRTPYIVPYGGSNPIGAAAYVEAMTELIRQLRQQQVTPSTIIVASSSGGTQAGLVAGACAHHYEGRILGISVDPPAETLAANVHDLATRTAEHLGLRIAIPREAVQVNDDYLGEGYARLGEPEREAIRLVARTEGLLLDPVYTGRAMAGLLDLIRKGSFRASEAVLFWHTGGTPALYAYADALR